MPGTVIVGSASLTLLAFSFRALKRFFLPLFTDTDSTGPAAGLEVGGAPAHPAASPSAVVDVAAIAFVAGLDGRVGLGVDRRSQSSIPSSTASLKDTGDSASTAAAPASGAVTSGAAATSGAVASGFVFSSDALALADVAASCPGRLTFGGDLFGPGDLASDFTALGAGLFALAELVPVPVEPGDLVRPIFTGVRCLLFGALEPKPACSLALEVEGDWDLEDEVDDLEEGFGIFGLGLELLG